ncbi:hypothetical protein N658DRAFT_506629 [Parathielavia hyrcaniae]|uniref:Uncharacterized protein n=1 Tax=Parathielavia hyrcaniae TaxID=113614 RepID=A0AAN6Q6Y5_9PEZI|nr:hypothetical protein N658DRAFT_506629 [Parathielavia hyrcaniae]
MHGAISAPEELHGQPASIFGDGRVSISMKHKADYGLDGQEISAKRYQNINSASGIDSCCVTIHRSTSTQPDAVDDRETTGFLSLPPELRLKIYGLVLKIDGPVVPQVEDDRYEALKSGFPKGAVLAMVLANKGISDEVTHFIFSNNSFCLTPLPSFNNWLARIGQHNSHLIREITVLLPRTGTVEQTNQLLELTCLAIQRYTPNLERLVIQSDNGALRTGSYPIRSLLCFAKRHSWNEAFPSLRHLTVKTACGWPLPGGNSLYRSFYHDFFQRTQLPVTGRYQVCPWNWTALSDYDRRVFSQLTSDGIVCLRLPEN